MGELIQVLYPSIILTVVACTHISVAVALPPGSLLLAPFYYNCETPQAGKWNCGPIGSHCHWIWCKVQHFFITVLVQERCITKISMQRELTLVSLIRQ